MHVHLSCPQCGAPLKLEETEHILECAYCRVRLMIFSRGACRFYLEPKEHARAETLFFMPYWRLKGIGYALDNSRVLHKLLDTSVLARKLSYYPPSLGLRSQALSLCYVTPEVNGDFFQPKLGRRFLLEQISAKLVQGTKLSSTQIHRQDFIGEIISLIYAPFYTCNNELRDGITGKALGKVDQNDVFEQKNQAAKKQNIFFTPTLCPYCGWDMLGKSKSVVLLCPGCYRAWTATSSGFKEIGLAIQKNWQGSEYQLPFWQIRIQGQELKLENVADLIRLTNIPRPILPKYYDQTLFFWIPAFKIRPDLFMRIAKRMTLAQLEVQALRRIPDCQLHPAELPLKEAMQSLPYVLVSLGPARRKVIPLVARDKIRADKARLVYLGFKRQGSEYLQEQAQMSISQKALEWGYYC